MRTPKQQKAKGLGGSDRKLPKPPNKFDFRYDHQRKFLQLSATGGLAVFGAVLVLCVIFWRTWPWR